VVPPRHSASRPAAAYPPAVAAPQPAAGGLLADRRGLTAAGGALLAAAAGFAGLVVDVLVGQGLGPAFAVAFVVGCALAALTVHREDLRAVVVMPPLLYAALAVVAAVAEGTAPVGAGLPRLVLVLANDIIRGAPVLFAATGVALALALVRGAGSRG
jgi:hypothetical protein